MILSPAIFDCDVLALQVAGFFQAMADGFDTESVSFRRATEKKAYYWNCGLLRAGRNWPRGCAAYNAKKFPPSHVHP